MGIASIIKFEDILRGKGHELPSGALPFQEFAQQFLREFSKFKGSEKREAARKELAPIPADVQPLDDALQPDGQPFFAIVRNISSDGMGLMFGKDVHSKYLEIQISTPSGGKIKTVIEVKHCTEKGMMIGGTSLTELRLS